MDIRRLGDLPGRKSERQFGHYSPYQEEIWQAIDDVYHSLCYGYEDLRMGLPGEPVDAQKFAAWQSRFTKAWQNESSRSLSSDRGILTRGPSAEEMPDNLSLYAYERMMSAGRLSRCYSA